jgi:hypothetical protein
MAGYLYNIKTSLYSELHVFFSAPPCVAKVHPSSPSAAAARSPSRNLLLLFLIFFGKKKKKFAFAFFIFGALTPRRDVPPPGAAALAHTPLGTDATSLHSSKSPPVAAVRVSIRLVGPQHR